MNGWKKDCTGEEASENKAIIATKKESETWSQNGAGKKTQAHTAKVGKRKERWNGIQSIRQSQF